MFLVGTGAAILVALVLLFFAKSSYSNANDRLNETTTELNRLQNLNPFPNPANLQTMKAQTADYGVALGKVKEELKARVLPATPLQPNEFQARLRETVTRVVEKAHANKVKLPENFFLGFDEFAAALPGNEAASALGQQLAQAEAIINILIDAHVDSITTFKRAPLPEEHVAVGHADSRFFARPPPGQWRDRAETGRTQRTRCEFCFFAERGAPCGQSNREREPAIFYHSHAACD